MSYVEETLMPNEEILKVAQLHWFIFVRPLVFLLVGLSIAVPVGSGAYLLVVPGAIGLVITTLAYISTELALTSKRVIAKFGWIRRETVELNHRQMESLGINQGIFGRLFGFGTVVVNGTGGVSAPIPAVVAPLEFRRRVLEVIDEG